MYLELLSSPHLDQITTLILANDLRLSQHKKGFQRFRTPFETVRDSGISAQQCDLAGDTVIIGQPDEINDSQRQMLHQTLRSFMPWRKGPFSVFGIDIDAEWRSSRKWNRLLPELPDLTGKIIADIGSNNGYYMFRMAQHQPRLVLGFEPYLQHYYAFKTLNRLAGFDNLRMELLGVEHIGLFENCFDVVFLMGILYHRHSPIDCLRDIKKALRPGGVLMIESQAIPGNTPVALFPETTYAKVPGTWFVPTVSCLANWLTRAGFTSINIFCTHPMSSEEQRSTDWMTFESYSDFIDPTDPTLTIEGHPAPLRTFIKAITPS